MSEESQYIERVTLRHLQKDRAAPLAHEDSASELMVYCRTPEEAAAVRSMGGLQLNTVLQNLEEILLAARFSSNSCGIENAERLEQRYRSNVDAMWKRMAGEIQRHSLPAETQALLAIDAIRTQIEKGAMDFVIASSNAGHTGEAENRLRTQTLQSLLHSMQNTRQC